MGFTEQMLDRLRIAGFDWQSGLPVPLFVVFIVGLAIFAYAKRTSTPRELQAFAIYLSLAAFLVFCAIVPLNPYWIALVAPFSILIIFANPRYLTLNSLLEVSIFTSLFLIYMLVGYSMYNSGIFRDLLFGQFIPPASPQRFYAPGDILRGLGLGGNNVVFLVGFMIACVIAVLIVNYPRASFIAGMPNVETIKRSVVWLRLGALAGFCALLFGMYLIPAPPTAYSSVSATPELTEADILVDDSVVEEEIEFDQTLTVSDLQIGLDAGAVTWIDSAVVSVSVLDSSGDPVFESSVAANSVGVGLASFRTRTHPGSGRDLHGAPDGIAVRGRAGLRAAQSRSGRVPDHGGRQVGGRRSGHGPQGDPGRIAPRMTIPPVQGRRLADRAFWVALVLSFAILAGWAVASPHMASPDEPAHAAKAAATRARAARC